MNLNLNHEGFESNLVEREDIHGGAHYLFRFDNGYGASVIKFWGSYGFEEDLWELAVIRWTSDDEYDLDYDTDISGGDVRGCLTDEEVRDLLKEIKEL